VNNGSLNDAYGILLKVYRDGAFINSEMKSVTSKRTAKIVYGVLDKHFELNYILDSLTKAKPNIKPLLLAGAYMIIYMNTPLNVVLNETGEILEKAGKGGIKKYCYAVLSKIYRREYALPKKSDKNYVEVKYNLPSFLVGMLRKDYPDSYEEIIERREYGKIHVVPKSGFDGVSDLKGAEKTITGFFVSNGKEISYLDFTGKLTVMSYPSSLAAESVLRKAKGEVLDVCAAPGGKSVYLADRGIEVTACDVYPHRLELINSYADRMGVKVNAVLKDGTEFCPEYENRFDVVFVDAPCSGIGSLNRRKDIVLRRTYEDILSIAALQKKLLDNVKRYVKKGGLLVYSTCTVLKKENDEIINAFISENGNFELEKIDLPFENSGKIQFLPDDKGMEGFYLCHLRNVCRT